jgi:hypothetical protein
VALQKRELGVNIGEFIPWYPIEQERGMTDILDFKHYSVEDSDSLRMWQPRTSSAYNNAWLPW